MKRVLLILVLLTTPGLLGIGLVRISEIRDERRIARDGADLRIADEVRIALERHPQRASLQALDVRGLVDRLCDEGGISKKTWTYVRLNAGRFAIEKGQFDVAWLVKGPIIPR